MLDKNRKATISFCSSVALLCVLCGSVALINFFTKDRITKEVVVGKNPVVSTKSIMTNQEPLTVILEDEKEKEKRQQEVKEAVLPKVEETMQQGKNQTGVKVISESQVQEEGTQEEIIESVREEAKASEEIQKPILTEYNGFATIGKIEIPQTGLDIPILNQVTVEGMKNAPCLLYATGELNQSGNNLIVGHNFRNGTIFSNNKNLKLGDKIYVTTLDGKKVEYTIYNKFITTAEDVSYIKRDTYNKPEITLSCCTDDDEYRIIILAKI